jgi:hypothetical protein
VQEGWARHEDDVLLGQGRALGACCGGLTWYSIKWRVAEVRDGTIGFAKSTEYFEGIDVATRDSLPRMTLTLRMYQPTDLLLWL